MSQATAVLINQSRTLFRAACNAILQAIQSQNSGPTAPTETYPYMYWADSANDLLKQRDGSDISWITIGKLSNGALVSVQTQAATAFTTSGSGTAYTLTPAPVLTGLVAGQRFRVKFHAVNGAAPTLAISALSAKNLKVYDSYGSKVAPAVGALALNMLTDVEYDGTDYVVLDALPVSLGYMLVQDQKPLGTDGGSSAAGNQGRVLNTVVRNTITGASLATNVITLPAGTYRARASAGCYIGNVHKIFLRDTTNSISYPGTNERANPSGDSFTRSTIDTSFTLTAPANFELRHQIGIAQGTNGLGLAVNVSAAGLEVYASVEIDKEA